MDVAGRDRVMFVKKSADGQGNLHSQIAHQTVDENALPPSKKDVL